MLRMQEKIENLESQSREFILTLPHHRDTLTIWSSEFEYIRKEFNSMSFEDLTTKILELEHKMEHQTPHFYPELTRILLYHYQESEVWRLKDMRSLKYVVDQLPRWEELKNDTKLMQALFK